MSGIEQEAWWQEFVDHTRRQTLAQMVDSAIVVSINPGGEPDIKYAVELGLSIMLDKPILLVSMPGREIPERLRRVADEVVECDLDLEAGRQAVTEALQRMIGE